jgi:hypothetical protein
MPDIAASDSPSKQPSVFISYSRANHDFADRIERALAAQGLKTWIDRKRLTGGGDWSEGLRAAIESCDALVVIISPRALTSEIVRHEYQYALSLNKLVVPILYKRVAAMPPELTRIQWSDCTREIGIYHVLYTLYKAGLIRPKLQSGKLNPPLMFALALHGAAPPDWRVLEVSPSKYMSLLIRYAVCSLLSVALCVVMAIAALSASKPTIVTPIVRNVVSLWPVAHAHPYQAMMTASIIASQLALFAGGSSVILAMIAYTCWNFYTGRFLGEILINAPECAVQRVIHLSHVVFPGPISSQRYCYFSWVDRLDRSSRWGGAQRIIARPRVQFDSRREMVELLISSRYSTPAATAANIMGRFWEYARMRQSEAAPIVDSALTMVKRGASLRVATPATPDQPQR